MAKPGFLNENENRSYPFIHGQEGSLPDCLIVDFGSTVLAGAGFVEGEHRVWLEWVRRLGDTLEFSFRSDAPGLLDKALIFQRNVTDPKFVTSYSYAQPALSGTQLGYACDCEANRVCNDSFDEVGPDGEDDPCDKYPGSEIFGWDNLDDATIAQQDGQCVITLDGQSGRRFNAIWQEVYGLETGAQVKAIIDVVEVEGTDSQRNDVIELAILSYVPGNDPPMNAPLDFYTNVRARMLVPALPGTYEVTYTVDEEDLQLYLYFGVIRGYADPYPEPGTLVVKIDDAYMGGCLPNTSSYVGEPPDPTVCPTDSDWEGFLVTGDLGCVGNVLGDCTFVGGGVPGSRGDVEVLFLIDTSSSMYQLLETVKDIILPIIDSVRADSPGVAFKWGMVGYRDFESTSYNNEPEYTANALRVYSVLTSNVSAFLATFDIEMVAQGGGDTPEAQLDVLKWVATHWESDLGGSDAQKLVIWIGDAPGWEGTRPIAAGAENSGRVYATVNQVRSSLMSAGVSLLALNLKPQSEGIDGWTTVPEIRQASALTSALPHSAIVNDVDDSDAEGIAKIITQQIVIVATPATDPLYSIVDGPAYVEPSRTKNLDGSYVRSLAVVNKDRTREQAAEGCRELCWPFEIKEHYVACECMAKDIRFQEGYNVSIRLDLEENALVFDAELGGGAGQPCTEVLQTPEEAPPSGRSTLSGALGCDAVVRSINGIGAQYFEIVGGAGVTVTPISDGHRVVVDFDFKELATCATNETDDVPVPTTPYSPDPCDCGPSDLPEVTTTQPPVEAAPGTCVYAWQQPLGGVGGWELLDSNCGDTEHCGAVDESLVGEYVGFRVLTYCQSAVCRLANNEFMEEPTIDANGLVTLLPGWTIASYDGHKGVIQWLRDGSVDSPRILCQGPVLRIFATPSASGHISQTTAVGSGHSYVLTAHIAVLSGDVDWGLDVFGHEAPNTWSTLEPEQIYVGSQYPDAPAHCLDDNGLFVNKRYHIPAGVTLARVWFHADKKLTYTGRGSVALSGVCLEPLQNE